MTDSVMYKSLLKNQYFISENRNAFERKKNGMKTVNLHIPSSDLHIDLYTIKLYFETSVFFRKTYLIKHFYKEGKQHKLPFYSS